MTLEQLRIFIGVAEREHMTRAAEALNVTQSAASAAIAALEARHGIALFHRVGRRIELTEAGRLFLKEAREVLTRARGAELALAELGGLKRGLLRLVSSHTIASYWLPPHLAHFRRQFPGITVDLVIDNSEGAAARVREGSAELGFIEGVVEDPALNQWVLASDAMKLVSAEPIAAADNDWLRAARWIVREQGSGTRSTFEVELRRRGLDPTTLTIAMTLPSNEAVRTAVEAGAGVATLSALVVDRALSMGVLHQVPLDLAERAFHGLRHKERYRSKAADALLDLIKDATR